MIYSASKDAINVDWFKSNFRANKQLQLNLSKLLAIQISKMFPKTLLKRFAEALRSRGCISPLWNLTLGQQQTWLNWYIQHRQCKRLLWKGKSHANFELYFLSQWIKFTLSLTLGAQMCVKSFCNTYFGRRLPQSAFSSIYVNHPNSRFHPRAWNQFTLIIQKLGINLR